MLEILVKHARPRSLKADEIPAILADEDFGFREAMTKTLAPYMEIPLTAAGAARILGKTTECARAFCLRHIAPLIERPIAPDDVLVLLQGTTAACRSRATGYLFGR